MDDATTRSRREPTTRSGPRGRHWLGASFVAALLTFAGTALGAPPSGRFVLGGNAGAGAKIYKKNCLTCHGKRGNGKGVAAISLNPKPTDFTDRKKMAKVTDERIYRVIRDGGQAAKKSPVMVPWKAALSDQQIRDVAAYVRTFAKGK